MMSEEKQPIFASPSESPSQEPIYQEKKRQKNIKFIVAAFLAFVVFNLVLSILMSAIQAKLENTLYVLLLISLLAFSQVEFFVVFFIWKEYLSMKHFYAVFLIGGAVIIECIATDILVFTVDHN